jgi:hypothetical protein
METVSCLPEHIPDAAIVFGERNPFQFADLHLPSMPLPPGGYPVIVFVHDGVWLAQWSKDCAGLISEALTEQGIATGARSKTLLLPLTIGAPLPGMARRSPCATRAAGGVQHKHARSRHDCGRDMPLQPFE